MGVDSWEIVSDGEGLCFFPAEGHDTPLRRTELGKS
jgi:hypothetical protein